MTEVEPEWVDITKIGSAYDLQMDVRAAPKAPDHVKYRHRPHSFSGQMQRDWSPGSPPR